MSQEDSRANKIGLILKLYYIAQLHSFKGNNKFRIDLLPWKGNVLSIVQRLASIGNALCRNWMILLFWLTCECPHSSCVYVRIAKHHSTYQHSWRIFLLLFHWAVTTSTIMNCSLSTRVTRNVLVTFGGVFSKVYSISITSWNNISNV